ncbi:MAG: DUF3784 domain-containing protein [Eubacterium sp.]|nr:DUF3784 domain-containing protein [Eubacterium sp.]
MTMQDVSTGPGWVLWAAFLVITVLSIVLLSGHGANLIAGYNTEGKEKKAQYNEKKLCRVTGVGMAVIAALFLIAGLFEHILPAYFAYILLGLIFTDIVVMIVLGSTVCRNKKRGSE